MIKMLHCGTFLAMFLYAGKSGIGSKLELAPTHPEVIAMREKTFLYEPQRYLISGLVLIASLWTVATVYGHGGKHAGQFSRLQALQEATKMYDQLISKGKLDQGWETGLENVTISSRNKNGKDETVVSFKRSEGDPREVYIFFNAEGKYAGSNFTGD